MSRIACPRREFLLTTMAALSGPGILTPQSERPRARDLGLATGVYPPGPLNAITDVAGVRAGHETLIKGENIRTGVTAILPHPGNLFQDKVPGGVFAGNAFGKLAGSTQVQELGTIETPIVLTNTLIRAYDNPSGQFMVLERWVVGKETFPEKVALHPQYRSATQLIEMRSIPRLIQRPASRYN